MFLENPLRLSMEDDIYIYLANTRDYIFTVKYN